MVKWTNGEKDYMCDVAGVRMCCDIKWMDGVETSS